MVAEMLPFFLREYISRYYTNISRYYTKPIKLVGNS